jgi:hypothetical protein
MFQITFTKFGEAPRHYDLHGLPIAGTHAHLMALQKLTVHILFHAQRGEADRGEYRHAAGAFTKAVAV